MAKRKRKFAFGLTDAFSKSRRAAKTPEGVAEILWRAYARQTTGEKVPGIKALSNPIKFKDVKNLDVSVSVLFGSESTSATILPNLTKLNSGSKVELRQVANGIREARLFLSSTKKIQPILKAAFELTVTKRLKQRWRDKGGSSNLGKQTIGSTGRSAVKGEGTEPLGEGISAIQGSDVIATRTAEFKSAGVKIGSFLTDASQLVVQGKFVGLRSLREFTQLEVGSSSSPFRSVFLMLEFGTGRFARPTSFIRRFSGSKRTRYKVPPFVARQTGADTASWFNIGRAAALARNLQKEGLSTKASEIFLRSVVLPGRRPRHIIFQERGIARDLIVAKKKALKEVIRLINVAVTEKHPGWGALVLKKVNIPTSVSLTLVL